MKTLLDELKDTTKDSLAHTLSDVTVHHTVNQPAGLNANAYARGTEIHISPGQEKHLPHEAWHVVQQR
jgi:hypothetical protein